MNYLKKRIESFRHAFCGLVTMLRNEPSAVLHSLAFVVVVAVGILLRISASEWVAVIIVSGGVIATEALNTAIEELSDMISKDFHPTIKKVKDLSAAAVLVFAIAAAATGFIIFVPKIIDLL